MKRKSSRDPEEKKYRLKSHSRSKSHGKRKKNLFYFNQSSVMLTYSHVERSDFSKKQLADYLYDTFKAKVVVACEEPHKDGNPHYHIWVEFGVPFYSRNCRVFDYRGIHPNIGEMLNKQKNTRNNALTYMTKTDDNLYCIGIDIEEWKYSCKNKTKDICEDLLSGKVELKDMVEKQPQLLMNYEKLKHNLDSYNLDKAEKSEKNRINENIWIAGPPGSGKTYYATHNFGEYYFKQLNNWWDGYKNQKTVIVDELSKLENKEMLKMGHYLKIWSDNYMEIGEVKGGSIALNYDRIIVTSNYMPKILWPSDRELRFAIYRRFRFGAITGNYPNFKFVGIDNPMNTED